MQALVQAAQTVQAALDGVQAALAGMQAAFGGLQVCRRHMSVGNTIDRSRMTTDTDRPTRASLNIF